MRSGTVYISQGAIKESFRPPFSKGGRFSGRRPEAHSAECEILHRSKNAGEGEFLCEAKEEGEPSSGVLLYLWLGCAPSRHNIKRHSFAFSFGCVSAKEKASQKENAVFSGALPLLTPFAF